MTSIHVINLAKLDEAIKTQHVCVRRQRCASVSVHVLRHFGRSPLEQLDGMLKTPEDMFSAVDRAIQAGKVTVRKHQQQHQHQRTSSI